MTIEIIEGAVALPLVSLKVVRNEAGEVLGINVEEGNGDICQADKSALDDFIFKKTNQLRGKEDRLLKILALHEKGEREEIISMIRGMENFEDFFLFFLDYLEDPKSRAKAGGDAKKISLSPYKNRAVREYSEKKIERLGRYKQAAFADDFVETMKSDYERVQEELKDKREQLLVLIGELDRVDFDKRKSCGQAEELRSLKEEIRVLETHPKPVSPKTVVTWLAGV